MNLMVVRGQYFPHSSIPAMFHTFLEIAPVFIHHNHSYLVQYFSLNMWEHCHFSFYIVTNSKKGYLFPPPPPHPFRPSSHSLHTQLSLSFPRWQNGCSVMSYIKFIQLQGALLLKKRFSCSFCGQLPAIRTVRVFSYLKL